MTIFADASDRFVQQDVLARLDYAEDWSDFMALAPGDSIATSDWAADDPGLALTDAMVDGPVTGVWISGGAAGRTYRVQNRITTAEGRGDVRYFFLSVADGAAAAPVLKTALFDRFTSVAAFKTESLAFLDGSFPVDKITDALIWSKLVTAEAEAAHELRVLLQPTTIVPSDAPQAELDALTAAGTPFVVERPYDYDPADWSPDAWGYIKLQERPVIRVDSVRFSYPNPQSDVLVVPANWLRLDHRYGHLQFVPSGTLMGLGPLSAYMMQAMNAGRVIPGMIHVRYVAGLENAARDYPDLVTLVKRMAILSILKSAFLPQSGSISADGLSQSTSIDTGKWQEEVDRDLGVLRDKIHGIRFGAL